MTTFSRAVGQGRGPFLGERLRRAGLDRFVLAYGPFWIWWVITGFRMIWQPLEYSEEAPSNGAIRQLFMTAAAGLAIRRMLYTQTLGQVIGAHGGPVLLGAVMVLSTLYSNDRVLTIKRSMVYCFALCLLLGLVHAPRRPYTYYLKAVVLTTGWIAWVSIIAHFALPKTCTTLSIRPGLAGWAGHPNVFGPCLQMAWGIGLGMPLFSKRERYYHYFLMAGLIIALFLANSVTALIATTAATGLFVILTTTSYRAGAIQITAVAIATLVFIIGPSNLKSMAFEILGRDESMSGRDTLWADVFREGMKTPWFGSGYGSFWYEGRGREITGTWNPRQSHNAYLDVFVDLGLFGVIFVLVLVPLRCALFFYRFMSVRGTYQRNAMAAYFSMTMCLCFIGAFGESFYLKLDKYQFFVLFWGLMVIENRDKNWIPWEFAQLEHENPRPPPTKRALRRHGPVAKPPVLIPSQSPRATAPGEPVSVR